MVAAGGGLVVKGGGAGWAGVGVDVGVGVGFAYQRGPTSQQTDSYSKRACASERSTAV